ncbi:MAG: ABC transporter ATP-binding protein [Anaerolineales bacterium]|nr:ABC transporter ATP-binding protein [Anaerolineales bacterium]
MDICLERVTHTYPGGVTALAEVSLTVRAGEAVAIIGQNGAGKTSLVKHLNGLLLPTSGRVRLGEVDTRRRSVAQLAALVGYVFQNPDDQLFQPSVAREAAFGPRNLGWPAARAQAAAAAALEATGLTAVAAKHPYDLAPAERKRVALAAVLAMQTPVLVFDEPTTGQDAAGVARIGALIADLHREGRTLISVTHDLDFCAECFARVIVMGEGRVLADGPTAAVLAQAEVLAQTDVEPPQLMRLAAQLPWGDAPLPLTAEDFAAGWVARHPPAPT